ncbi:glycosyl hydrolase [Flavobacterium sp. XS2P39]|uniref:glycosyl hydrolase n=1 Tax=Flavobacterium sp. XS2P39 TaxID=3401725 RepID=UPI003AAE2CA1
MKKSFSLYFIVTVLCFFSVNQINAQSKSPKVASVQWFPYFNFDVANFQKAPREFGPFTRWWLPGNDVTSEELQREIKVLANNGFAGVEVQPLTMGLNPKAPQEQIDRVYSWDTPSFYGHLRAIMQQAQISKIIVDMNGGSGWPLGGSFFDPKESMKTLAVADSALVSGSLYNGLVPMMKFPKPESGGLSGSSNLVKPEWGILKSVIAAKALKIEEKQAVLDQKSVVNLTDKVKNNILNWQVPGEGNWRLIASWSIPSGEKPSVIASKGTNYVIDHLDPEIVNKTYDYLLGSRAGLTAYFTKPLRAVFNDSYEFHTDRIISPDFIEVFKKQNGYDITPYLSSVVQKGYDHPTYLASMYPNAKPPYAFDPVNQWRIMYDYDQTVAEVFKNNFIKTSNNWMQKHGLLHRTQAYGFPTDLIGTAAAAAIPEAEQLFAEGSEGYLKLVTSGAHLNNRPVITQESFVSILRAEMTTPQKIKIWADKSFACGINQLIYHGTPYKYNNGEYGKEGWNTWSSSFVPYINFSTGMNESDPFWKDLKEVNQYLARCQYALRAGKPQTDVLIYMPFNNFTEDQIGLNPEETMIRGYFKGMEPDIKGFGVYKPSKTALNTWYNTLWETVNELEAKGITWEFVNDEYLQKANVLNGKINIQGNQYQTLILANLPYVNLKTAKHINNLSKTGMNVWAIGAHPIQQPSYLDFEKNDLLTAQLMNEIWNEKHTIKIASKLPVETIIQKIRFSKEIRFSRQINREMADGSIIKFISNKTDQWQTIELTVDEKLINCYWFNAEDGSAIPAKGQNISYRLSPYGSVLLYASSKKTNVKSIVKKTIDDTFDPIVTIGNWNMKIGENKYENSPLFDWKDNEQTKFNSEDGLYSANFSVDKIQAGKTYIVDLGKVFYVAYVKINGVDAGKRLFSPYSFDITKLLKQGQNSIEVTVITTRRNGFTGEAVRGNSQYAQFKGKKNILVPSGLVGPVVIKIK